MPENSPTPANRAVFLSYASQDTVAAKQICAALRSAGIEVWFDQSELVGGDAWDAKIRGQIGSCALFVPVISAATQARGEGYFRLEWKLAVDRSHLMAHDQPFLLPVVIDATADAAARVPPEFRTVQWTKLPGGETPPAFVARVRKLLSEEQGERSKESGSPLGASLDDARDSSPLGRRQARPLQKSRPWLIPAILGVAVLAALALWQPWKKDPPSRAETKPLAAVAAPVSEARKLAHQAMQLLEDPNFTRETSWLADELCQRALALEAGDAEIWATAAMASINLYWNTYDTSAGRREKISSQASRAAQLDPKSVRAALAVARSLDLNYDSAESLRILRELHQRAPDDQQVIFHLIRAEGQQGNDPAAQVLLQKLRALPRTGLLPLTLWFVELRLRGAGRFAEAGTILDEMLSGPEQLRGAYYEKLHLLMESWHDLAEVEPYLGQIPTGYLQEPAFGSLIAQYWLWRNKPEKALQALDRVPQAYFEEYAAQEPKGYHTGWAHTLAGRPAAAQAEWRNALALIEERMKSDNRNFTLLDQRALLLALTDQREAAREAWRLRVELGGEQNRPHMEAEAKVLVALGDSEPAVSTLERGWARLTIGQRARTLPVLRYHPAFAAVRDDPRLQRISTEGVEELRQLREKQTGIPKPVGATAAQADAKSVAVLAFANLSDDKANEYFSDGISEELLNVLAKVPGLKVTARTSSFHFKGKDTPVPEIAQQLGVAYVVEGSVRKAGDKVRITAQLIKAADGFHVWSDTFTRDLKDIFAVQDEIAGLIAQQLQLKLGANKTARAVDPEAHRLMLEGRHFLAPRTAEGFDQAERAFRQALKIDPQFAQAQAGLATTTALRGRYRLLDGVGRVEEFDQLAIAQSQLALQMDSTLSEPHATMGFIYTDNRQLGDAEQEFKLAFAANPNYATAYHWHSHVLASEGRLDLALKEIGRAEALDPVSFIILFIHGFYYCDARQYDKALAVFDRAAALRMESFLPLEADRARALLELGRKEEALATARKVLRDPRLIASGWFAAGEALNVLYRGGAADEANGLARSLIPLMPAGSYQRGYALCAVGNFVEGLPLLEHLPDIVHSRLYWHPMLDTARDTPAFQQLIVKFNCAPQYQVARETLARMLKDQEAKK